MCLRERIRPNASKKPSGKATGQLRHVRPSPCCRCSPHLTGAGSTTEGGCSWASPFGTLALFARCSNADCNRRIAQDLKLDEPPPAGLLEREKLNRLRTWFQIVSVDSSNAIQKGQPTWAQRNNFTSQMTNIWYRCSPLNSPYDIYCSAYADLMLFTSNIWGHTGPTSMNSQEVGWPA